MTTSTHPVDEQLPFGRLFTLGLQHVLVMYAGKVVEEVKASDLKAAQHPYTRGLLNCLPAIDGNVRPLPTLERDAAWAT